MNTSHPNKENVHPNRMRICEDDISKISKQYVLDGERLKEKSAFEWDNIPVHRKKNQQPQQRMGEFTEEIDLEKLEYLEELGVLNQEEEHILETIRANKQVPIKLQQPQMNPFGPQLNSYNQFPPQYYNNLPYANQNYPNNSYEAYSSNIQTPECHQHFGNYYNVPQNHYY